MENGLFLMSLAIDDVVDVESIDEVSEAALLDLDWEDIVAVGYSNENRLMMTTCSWRLGGGLECEYIDLSELYIERLGLVGLDKAVRRV